MNYKSIGKNIRKRRDMLGITQEALAETVKISTSYMGAVERGEKIPKLKIFIRIANALDISANVLLADVLKVGNDIIASSLSEQLSQLPQKEQRRILNVVQTMILDSKKE